MVKALILRRPIWKVVSMTWYFDMCITVWGYIEASSHHISVYYKDEQYRFTITWFLSTIVMRCVLFVSVIRVITIEMSLLALDARSRVAQLTLVIKRAHSHWGGTYFPLFLPVLLRSDILTCQTLVFERLLQHSTISVNYSHVNLHCNTFWTQGTVSVKQRHAVISLSHYRW